MWAGKQLQAKTTGATSKIHIRVSTATNSFIVVTGYLERSKHVSIYWLNGGIKSIHLLKY
jgi:hypothetical protein